MELRLARRLMAKRPLGVLLQVLALCLGFGTVGISLALYGTLTAQQPIAGAACASQARWLSIEDSSGYWSTTFKAAQVRVLGEVLGIPVYPTVMYKTTASVDDQPLTGKVLGINSDALAALCVSLSAGHPPVKGRDGAVLSASTTSRTVQVGTQDLPITGSGTAFRGFSSETDPADVFLPLDTLARAGFNAKTVDMPVLAVFVSARTAGQLPSDNELTRRLRSRPDVFPDVALVHLSHNLGHVGEQDFTLDHYSKMLGVLGLALFLLGLVNIATYQLSRQADLGWRCKVLRDMGAGPWALRRLAYIEPLTVTLGSALLAILLLVPSLRVMTSLLDLPYLAERESIVLWGFAVLLGLALCTAAVLGELRYRAAGTVRSRRIRRLVQGYFRYAGALQTFACVITLALAVAALGGYLEAMSGPPNYNVDHVRVYSLRLAAHHKPQGMAARWEGVLDPLGKRVHGAAAASLFLLPLPLSYGYASNGVSYKGHGTVVAAANNVTPGYFDVLQLPLSAGRMFGYESLPTIPRREGTVAVVNNKLAAQLGLGKHPARHLPLRMKSYIVSVDGKETAKLHTVGMVKEGSSGNDNPHSELYLGPDIYLPMPDFTDRVGFYYLLVRHGNEVSVATVDKLAQQAIKKLTPNATLLWAKDLRTIYASATASERSLAWLFGVLGLGALALVLCGVFGISLFSLELDRQSLATRFTMGATLRSLMRHHAWLVGAPLGAGVAAGALAFALFGHLDVAFLARPVLPIWIIALLAGVIVSLLTGLAIAATCLVLQRADFYEWLRTE